MMDEDLSKTDPVITAQNSVNWCNFCGYTTESLDEYLAHSCIDVLKSSGTRVVKSDQSACT